MPSPVQEECTSKASSHARPYVWYFLKINCVCVYFNFYIEYLIKTIFFVLHTIYWRWNKKKHTHNICCFFTKHIRDKNLWLHFQNEDRSLSEVLRRLRVIIHENLEQHSLKAGEVVWECQIELQSDHNLPLLLFDVLPVNFVFLFFVKKRIIFLEFV